ncbi:MAG: amidohydrolase family protein [Chloroflexota bacterium]
MIVDSHVHVVSTDEKAYPIRQMTALFDGIPRHLAASALWYRTMPIPAEQLLKLMEEAGVERAVLVQPVIAYSYDNSYTTDSARHYPGKFVAIGAIDMLEKGAPDRLSYWVKERGMAGLRLFTGRDASWIDDPRTFPVWERASTFKLPICIHVGQHELPRIRDLLKRFPSVPLLLDHLASPHIGGDHPPEAPMGLFELAKFPNLYLKFSTMNFDALGTKPGLIHDVFQQLVERFGAERMMWGSNFPTTHNRPYKAMVELAQESLAFLGEENLKWLLGETALRLWPALA